LITEDRVEAPRATITEDSVQAARAVVTEDRVEAPRTMITGDSESEVQKQTGLTGTGHITAGDRSAEIHTDTSRHRQEHRHTQIHPHIDKCYLPCNESEDLLSLTRLVTMLHG